MNRNNIQKNSLLRQNKTIIRILELENEKAFIIDCVKRSMPKWVLLSSLCNYEDCTYSEMAQETVTTIPDFDTLDTESKRFIREHFTLIAPILPFISDEKQRKYVINQISEEKRVSKQTIRNYLCLYLVYQNIAVFCPKQRDKRELTEDEKKMRWGLNRFYYTQHKNSLTAAYTMTIRAKFCDDNGILMPNYPSINQFRYFEKKYRKMQNYFISRDGLKGYQKNHRPLLGDGIQEFASNVGIAMLDATVCDIYLIDDSGNLVGRPILVLAIDGYSGMCVGYSLLWEGGVYSLRGLMLNIIADKVEHCKKFGITIERSDWDCDKLPATLVTDMGSEFISSTFEQIVELGVTLVNLPAYRPELKGNVEKAFDLIQGYFKPYLKGKGIIEPDFQQRGVRDYRKDACLNLLDFEKIILHCIIYYNSKRIVENFPYTQEMLAAKVKPYANCILEWGKTQAGANLIKVDKQQLILTLLPRATGKFSRFGLKVNKMRYKHENFTEKYLSGGTVTVAYNPDDVSYVWLIEDGVYIRFELIESRFKDMNLSEVQSLQEKHKKVVNEATEDNLQAKINLAQHIEIIAQSAINSGDISTKGIRNNRHREQAKTHVDFIEKVGATNE